MTDPRILLGGASSTDSNNNTNGNISLPSISGLLGSSGAGSSDAQLRLQLQHALLKAQQQQQQQQGFVPTQTQTTPPLATGTNTSGYQPAIAMDSMNQIQATATSALSSTSLPTPPPNAAAAGKQHSKVTQLLDQVFQQDQNPSTEKIYKLASLFQVKPENIAEWFVRRRQMELVKQQMKQQQQQKQQQISRPPVTAAAPVSVPVPAPAATVVSTPAQPQTAVSSNSSSQVSKPKDPVCIFALALVIGTWTWKCKYVGDLCMELDFVKETISWMRLSGGYIQKIQFQFNQVSNMIGQASGNYGQFQFALAAVPVFMEESDPAPPEGPNPQPKRWRAIENFTGNPVANLLVHRVVLSRQVYAKVELLFRSWIPKFRDLLEHSAARFQLQQQQQAKYQ